MCRNPETANSISNIKSFVLSLYSIKLLDRESRTFMIDISDKDGDMKISKKRNKY